MSRRRGISAIILLLILLLAAAALWGVWRAPRDVLTHLFPLAPPRLVGCGGAAVAAATYPQTMTSGGITRTYLLHVPRGYNPDHPLPLVVGIHGRGGSARIAEEQSGLSVVADARGFVVAYPDGTVAGDPEADSGPRTWNAGVQAVRGADLPDDVAFVRALVSTISTRYCIDPRRVYAAGVSAGGAMVGRMACQSDAPFAAVAVVAGVLVDLPEGCHPTRPVAVLQFHGTADPIMPYAGGVLADGTRIVPARAWAAAWAARDGCPLRPRVDRPLPDAIRIARGGCRDGTAVVLYTIVGGGHTWPGRPYDSRAGPVSRDVHASDLIWAFFAAHPRQ